MKGLKDEMSGKLKLEELARSDLREAPELCNV